MNYDNAFIEKVRAFGILGYPVHEIIFLVEPDDPGLFEKDIRNPDSEIYKAYHKGKATGRYTMDKSLFDNAKNNSIDANDKLNQRQDKKRVDTVIYENFGL
jgi:hypothetical protein